MSAQTVPRVNGPINLNDLMRMRRENPGATDLLARLLKESTEPDTEYTDPSEADPVEPAPAAHVEPELAKPAAPVKTGTKRPAETAASAPAPKKAAPGTTSQKPRPVATPEAAAAVPEKPKLKPKPAAAAPEKPKTEAAVPEKPKPKPKAAPEPEPPKKKALAPAPGSVDTTPSKVFAARLLKSDDPTEALHNFMATNLLEVCMLPRQNPRMTLVTLLGAVVGHLKQAYAWVDGAETQIDKMVNEKTLMAVRRIFQAAVVDRLTTNRPPFYKPNFDAKTNTPNFNDAGEIADTSAEAVEIVLNQAMSQWYAPVGALAPLVPLLKDARGVCIHVPIAYSPEKHGEGLRCLMTNAPIKPDGRDLCELEISQPKGVIDRIALSAHCAGIASAFATDRMRTFMLNEDVQAYLMALRDSGDSERLDVAGSLAATSGLGVYMAMRSLVRLSMAQLTLRAVSPRVRS